MCPLPPRDANTMSDAIALSSPSGRLSKRAKDKAVKRLALALFGPTGLQRPAVPQPTERERLLRQAAQLRELAARGMNRKKFIKEAERLEQQAANV